MKKLYLLSALFLSLTISRAQDLKSPEELAKSPEMYLGYEIGTRYSWHRDVVSYFKYIAENSESVTYKKYGESYEGRELGVVFVSSPENIKDLEQLRKNNLINIGLLEGEPSEHHIPFIWLSYNVHGNEPAGMEAALKTLYALVTRSHESAENWLKDMVVVIDPCQNPDGRDRNTHRFEMTRSKDVNVNPDDMVHHEEWPASRSNHYLLNLNRDWICQKQVETVRRIRLYNRYMPQVHADFHEMPGPGFYFPPGARPWHEVITPWQRNFQTLIGEENAKLFDEKQRLYFTIETFDLLSPAYGDTWPMFNGAIGLTYEQSRGKSAGLNVKTENGDTLTLKERIDNHFMAAMATLQVSWSNRDKLMSEFRSYFTSGLKNPAFGYGSILIKGDNERSAVKGLLDLLDKNQIRYSRVNPTGKSHRGFDYLKNREGEVKPEEGDILVSAFQPQSHLVKVMFDPHTRLTDSVTFDLTAWVLPYVYNLETYALKERLEGDGKKPDLKFEPNVAPGSAAYAYIADWSGFNEVRLLAQLFRKKINIRYAGKPFGMGLRVNKPGTFIIARADNRHLGEQFDKLVVNAANKCCVKLQATTTGLTENGVDIGSPVATLKKSPRIALISGSGIRNESVGSLWYFFEQEIDYPVTRIGTGYLESVDLSTYDVVLLPSGKYDDFREKLVDYVKDGGRVVAIEKALSLFAGDSSTNLYKSLEMRKKELELEKEKVKSTDSTHLRRYGDRAREKVSGLPAGCIYRVGLDVTHPYSFGMGKEWFVMPTSPVYPFLSGGNNIGYILESDPVSGFAGSRFKKEVKNSMVISSEKMGKGEVVYLSCDPYFRAFWSSGRILLGNIIFR